MRALTILVTTLGLSLPLTAAAQKRSAGLAVRVTVVRSCTVTTTAVSGSVTCDSKSGPAARTTTSVLPATATPPARETAAAATPSTFETGTPASVVQEQVDAAQEVAVEAEVTEEDAATVVASGDTAESGTTFPPAADDNVIRLLTINF